MGTKIMKILPVCVCLLCLTMLGCQSAPTMPPEKVALAEPRLWDAPRDTPVFVWHKALCVDKESREISINDAARYVHLFSPTEEYCLEVTPRHFGYEVVSHCHKQTWEASGICDIMERVLSFKEE